MRADLTGARFGRWTALRPDSKRLRYWVCRCDCGTERAVFDGTLRNGQSQSCRCITRERLQRQNPTHGLSHTPEYRIWAEVKKRCLNPHAKAFRYYGGRGIRICDRWKDSFPAFLADVGLRPSPQHSIDRLRNEGHYEPDNVRWATVQEQARNRRTVHHVLIHDAPMLACVCASQHGIQGKLYHQRVGRGWTRERAATAPRRTVQQWTFNGQTRTLQEWADTSGIYPRTLRSRVQALGWDIGRALTTPVKG